MNNYLQKLKSTSPLLYDKIKAFPLNTQLRDQSKKTEEEYDKLQKFKPKHQEIMKAPDSFDGRIVWRGLIVPPLNQGSCGSCWSFSTTSCLADRFNIQSQGMMHVVLSPAKMILCDAQGEETKIKHPEEALIETDSVSAQGVLIGACNGESLYNAWRYLYLYGTVEESCVPYDLSNNPLDFSSLGTNSKEQTIPLCTSVTGALGDMCYNSHLNIFTGEEYGDAGRAYRCKHFYAVAGTKEDEGNEYNIRYDIYRWGPVSTGMKVYSDFYQFNPKKDIYSWNGEGEQVGGHAIEIVGWGVDSLMNPPIPFWIIKNSWGTDWGDNGYFRMKRGNNECGIEENVIACVPDFFYPFSHDVAPNVWAETDELKALRKTIDTDVTYKGGGIDPSTGYSRRVMATKPWINFNRPIPLSKLHNRVTFIAGRDAHIDKRQTHCTSPHLEIIVTICIVISILLSYYFYRKRSIN